MSVDANIQQQLQAVYNRHPDFLLVATASSSSEKSIIMRIKTLLEIIQSRKPILKNEDLRSLNTIRAQLQKTNPDAFILINNLFLQAIKTQQNITPFLRIDLPLSELHSSLFTAYLTNNLNNMHRLTEIAIALDKTGLLFSQE